MPVSPGVREIFSRFENLNLLALMHDLRDGRAARHAWRSGSLLCPVAHGLAGGRRVRELAVLGQAAALSQGCEQAARQLGADPDVVFHFVRRWDDEAFGPDALLRQLEEIWRERLEDAAAVQELLQGTSNSWACDVEGGPTAAVRSAER